MSQMETLMELPAQRGRQTRPQVITVRDDTGVAAVGTTVSSDKRGQVLRGAGGERHRLLQGGSGEALQRDTIWLGHGAMKGA